MLSNKCTLFESYVGKSNPVYGLKIETNLGETLYYNYISSVYSDAKALCDRLSHTDVSPIHFNDIVRDYITQIYYEKLAINHLSLR